MSDITHGGRITPANMAALFTPQAAARIKSQVLMFRLGAPDEHSARLERMLADDGGHRWFGYCLDAAARRLP